MKRLLALGLIVSSTALAQDRSLEMPPPPFLQAVTETYFGTTVTDPYRYIEDADDPVALP